MSESAQVLLTTEQIEQWERESVELARKIADYQARLDDLRAKLKAAELFKPKKLSNSLSDFFSNPPPPPPLPYGGPLDSAPIRQAVEAVASEDGDNLTAAIERIANSAARPVAKKALKQMLAKEGFAPDRLANYFYTAIHRLKAKNRISVLEDGSVWMPKPQGVAGHM